MTDSGLVFVATLWDMLRVVVPAALCLMIWRTSVTNKSQPVSFLGLEHATANSYDEPAVSKLQLFAYVLTALITFGTGVLVSQLAALLSMWLTVKLAV